MNWVIDVPGRARSKIYITAQVAPGELVGAILIVDEMVMPIVHGLFDGQKHQSIHP